MRRRFQDFAFLHDHLLKSFPACIIPPIPDKHRLGEYNDVMGATCGDWTKRWHDGARHVQGDGVDEA